MTKTSISVGVQKNIECDFNCNKPQACMVEFDAMCKDCNQDVAVKMGFDIGSLGVSYGVQNSNYFLISTLYNALAGWANGTVTMLKSAGFSPPQFVARDSGYFAEVGGAGGTTWGRPQYNNYSFGRSAYDFEESVPQSRDSGPVCAFAGHNKEYCKDFPGRDGIYDCEKSACALRVPLPPPTQITWRTAEDIGLEVKELLFQNPNSPSGAWLSINDAINNSGGNPNNSGNSSSGSSGQYYNLNIRDPLSKTWGHVNNYANVKAGELLCATNPPLDLNRLTCHFAHSPQDLLSCWDNYVTPYVPLPTASGVLQPILGTLYPIPENWSSTMVNLNLVVG